MLIVHVLVHVKQESIEDFKQATLANALESVKEPGVARFDVVQDREDPARFVLVEVYRHSAAPAAHKNTEHYKAWRAVVEPMMATARSSKTYANVYPDDAGW
jgi:quinol monooxygenase YgiN